MSPALNTEIEIFMFDNDFMSAKSVSKCTVI